MKQARKAVETVIRVWIAQQETTHAASMAMPTTTRRSYR